MARAQKQRPFLTPKRAPLDLLILHRHRNTPAIVAVVEAGDLQSAAKAELQSAVGAEPRRCGKVGNKAGDAGGAAMTALQIDAGGQMDPDLGTGFTAHGDYAGQGEAAQIDHIAAHAPHPRSRVDFDLTPHRADRNAAHVEMGFYIDT